MPVSSSNSTQASSGGQPADIDCQADEDPIANTADNREGQKEITKGQQDCADAATHASYMKAIAGTLQKTDGYSKEQRPMMAASTLIGLNPGSMACGAHEEKGGFFQSFKENMKGLPILEQFSDAVCRDDLVKNPSYDISEGSQTAENASGANIKQQVSEHAQATLQSSHDAGSSSN